jgi:hypothetical protein
MSKAVVYIFLSYLVANLSQDWEVAELKNVPTKYNIESL